MAGVAHKTDESETIPVVEVDVTEYVYSGEDTPGAVDPFVVEVREHRALEQAETHAEEILLGCGFSEAEASAGALLIRELALESISRYDISELDTIAKEVAETMGPVTMKFALVRNLERDMGSGPHEVEGGPLADALDRLAPMLRALRNRI